MKRSMFFLSIMLTAMLGTPLHALAEPLYTLTVIGGAGSVARAMNSAGQVVGSMTAGEGSHAFFYDGAAVFDLGTLGGVSSHANGLNDSGAIVGNSLTTGGTWQAFVYTNGAMSGLPFSEASYARGVNNAGTIVGTFNVPVPGSEFNEFRTRAFTYANGVVTNLGVLGRDYPENISGVGINDAGIAVGSSELIAAPDYPREAFVYGAGGMQGLGNLGGQSSDAYAINDAGQVVGSAGVEVTPTRPNAYTYHAFLYSDGVLQDLGALTDRGNSVAYAINNLGQAVGSADTFGGNVNQAVLYENGAVVLLDTLIDQADGWTMINATGINDQHQIAGNACRLGLCYAVRLDLAPIPEPGQVLLLAAGLLALAGRRTLRALAKWRSKFISAAAMIAAVSGPVAAQAAPLYEVTVIGTAGSVAFDVNNLGQVVGQANFSSGTHAFFYGGSTLTDLGTLAGADSSAAFHVNDHGAVVGASLTGITPQAFLYSDGVLSNLGLGDGSSAEGINNAGVIVGTARFDADGNGLSDPRAFIDDHGVVTNLGLLPGSEGEMQASNGSAINAAGNVVGSVDIASSPAYPSEPFLYSGGVMQDLGNFGGIYGNAWSINDHDQIVGSAGVDDPDGYPYGYHAFLYEGGVLRDLGVLVEKGNSSAYDINNLGQIVGVADIPGGALGFLYVDGAMQLLDTLIDPASGWSITRAVAINDLQQIAGTACKDGVCYAVRLDLAAAIPEPQQVFMLVAGILILLIARLRSISATQTNNPRTRRGLDGHGSMRNAQTI